MKFEYAKFDSLKVDLDLLDEIMHQFGLVRAGQWDYERVTYDRKFEFQRDTFYLRVQGHAISGDVGGRHAVIHLMTPLLGKHYYPHGVEYGDGEYFPPSLVEQCEKILSQIKSQLETVQL